MKQWVPGQTPNKLSGTVREHVLSTHININGMLDIIRVTSSNPF